MKLEDQVVSLELAKQMREAGYPQGESYFVWIAPDSPQLVSYVLARNSTFRGTIHEIIAAPTVAELGEKLPQTLKTGHYFESTKRFGGGWINRYVEYEGLDEVGVDVDGECVIIDTLVEICASGDAEDNEGDTRARMWLWLKKNGYLEEK